MAVNFRVCLKGVWVLYPICIEVREIKSPAWIPVLHLEIPKNVCGDSTQAGVMN